MDINRILEAIREKQVRWISLHLTDLFGTLHQATVSAWQFDEKSAQRGFGKLDGSSVKGFKDISESDLVLKPVLDTFAITPFSEKTARFICQIYDTGGKTRYERDPRYIAEKAEKVLAEEGFSALMGAEPEFYFFRRMESWIGNASTGYSIEVEEAGFDYKVNQGISPKEGYYPAPPIDKTEALRRRTAEILEDYFGVKVESHHHEVGAAGQAEINTRAASPVRLADNIQTLKYVARNVAQEAGYIATFLPKPIYADNGSGMHVHASLWKGDENTFYDKSDDYAEVSQTARYFIGGLIEHGRSLSAIVSPTVNSYKRLVPGYEAPIYLAWSKSNRSAAVRVPVYHKGDVKGKRIEYRPPDPSANPYLAFSAIVLAGLDGIKKKIDPGDPIDTNIYKLGEQKRRELGIKQLPATLLEAIQELESDNEYLKPAFTSDVIEGYIEMKKNEWTQIEYRVSPAEIHFYSGV